MTVASRWGVAAGYRGACGIFLGDLILMILSATGAASLLQATRRCSWGCATPARRIWCGWGSGCCGPGCTWRGEADTAAPVEPPRDASIPSGWRCSSA
jgi:leucine efflux protein